MTNECFQCNYDYHESEGKMITLLTSEDDGPEVWICYSCIEVDDE